MNLLVSLVLAAAVIACISLQRAYAQLPVRELKRRAREHDRVAELLHRAAAYGQSLQTVLWFLIGLSSAGFFVYVSRHEPAWFAVLLSGAVVWLGFGWLTRKQADRISLWLGKVVAPTLAWLLTYLHPVLNWILAQIHKHWPVHVHTGVYEKEDLLELLNNQNLQQDNRINEQELALTFHALTFGDKLVGDHLTPRRVVKSVSVDDAIGPILMSELHKSGFSRFPVYEGKKDNIVGTLFMKDLVKTKQSGKVREVMRREVCFVHEDQTLYDALQAVIKTRHHLLVVVNSFEEYVGVLSIEDLFEELVGQPILDEFDQYDDLRAVATRAAKKEHQAHAETDGEVIQDT